MVIHIGTEVIAEFSWGESRVMELGFLLQPVAGAIIIHI